MAEAQDIILLEFQSRAFDVPPEGDVYYNDCCRGADGVCVWLIAEFRKRGLTTFDAPDQEDWGWYFECGSGDAKDHSVGVAYMGEEDGTHHWQARLEKNVGFFASLFNKKSKSIAPEIAAALRDTLEQSDKIFDLQ